VTEGPKLIYKQIPAILAEVGHIGKDKQNKQQGYQYRGIDQLFSAIHPLFAAHKVFPTAEVMERHVIERESRGGGALFYTTLRIKYTLWAEDGSSVTTEAVGEAMDSGDKSSNKAMSAAYKYALFQLFCIPTEAVDSETETHDVAPKRTDVKYDAGPQRGPASVPQIEAQQKQSQRELMDTKPTCEPPQQERRQYDDEKPACPECGENKAVRFVAKSKREPGEPICYCWKREGGCGAKFDPPNTRNDDPNEGAQVHPRAEQEAKDSFDSWARILITAPVGAEQAAINTITKAYQDKRLTSEYVYQILERALAIAMTPQQVEAVEGMIVPLRDACKIPEQGQYGWLHFGELVPVAYDRTETARPSF
jgi:hypothetical protein